VTLSHALLREYREYERLVTTAVNAYVGPAMASHLRALERAVRGNLRVMQSSGRPRRRADRVRRAGAHDPLGTRRAAWSVRRIAPVAPGSSASSRSTWAARRRT
jgi:hypothetical protein